MELFPEASDKSLEDIIFSATSESEIGQRLGINYIRSQQEEINIRLGDSETLICLQQSSMGLMAISSVVWDAGILLVDFLVSLYQNEDNIKNDILIQSTSTSMYMPIAKLKQQWRLFNISESLKDVLELGSGTGIGGLACGYLGANQITFSDLSQSSILKQNIEPLQSSHLHCKIDFVNYNWEHSMNNIPESLLRPTSTSTSILTGHISSSSCSDINQPSSSSSSSSNVSTTINSSSAHHSTTSTSFSNTDVWHTVICSDVLYEAKLHPYLSKLLQSIKFQKLFLAYKRRNDDPEKKFLQELSSWCNITIVDNNSIQIVNLPMKSLSGMFIIIAIPFIYSNSP